MVESCAKKPECGVSCGRCEGIEYFRQMRELPYKESSSGELVQGTRIIFFSHQEFLDQPDCQLEEDQPLTSVVILNDSVKIVHQ